jgi:hypothetical protein
MSNKPVWGFNAFASLMADAFIENTELEGGHIANSAGLMGFLIQRLAKEGSQGVQELSLFSAEDRQTLLKGCALLKQCSDLAAVEVKKIDQLGQLLMQWNTQIGNLPIGQPMLVPGGWTGTTSVASVLHVVIKTEEGIFSFVTCNAGAGLRYHPSSGESPPNLKFKTCLRIDNIPLERFSDLGFWTLLFSQWMKQPASEYHREEVLYDVLLPWLSGKQTLNEAMVETANDPYAEWRFPQCSNSSPWRCVVEGMRYSFRMMGLSTEQLDQLDFALRSEMMRKVFEDLQKNTIGRGSAAYAFIR